MRRTNGSRVSAIGLLLILALLPSAAQSIGSAPDPAPPYRIIPVAEDEIVLGISPDSKTIVTGSYFPDCLRFYRAADFSLASETILPEPARLPREKKARWSPDGKRVALRSCQASPWELKAFRSSCIFTVDVADGTFVQVSDDRYREKISILDMNIYFDPDFAPGDGSVLYHKLTSNGTQVVAVDLMSREERILHVDPSIRESCYAYPLSGSFLLIDIEPNSNSEPDRLLVADARDRSSRVVLSSVPDGRASMFQVLDVGAGGKVALVSHVVVPEGLSGPVIESLYLLVFDEAGVPTAARIGNSEGRQIVAARLSPDGARIALIERATGNGEGENFIASVFRIDLAEGRAETMLSDSNPVVIPGFRPLGSGYQSSERLFLSDSSLLIGCLDGYRLYELR